MRTKAFIDGAAFGYLYQAIVMLAGLWLTPFLLRNLGQSDYGRWLICLQILGYAMLADFGTVAILPREIAYATGQPTLQEQTESLIRLMRHTARVVAAQTLFLALLSCGGFFFINDRIPRDFLGPSLLMLAGFVVFFPMRLFPAVLEGLQELRLLGKIRSIIWVVSTITTCLAVILGCRMYSLAFGWIVNQIGSALVCYLSLRRLFPDLTTRQSLFGDSRLVWSDLFKGSWISVGQVAQLLVQGSDLLIVGRILGPTAVVLYSCTGKLLSVLANQPLILIQTAMPGLSQVRALHSRDKLVQVTTAMSQGMLLLTGAVAILVIALNGTFVTLWVGKAFFGGAALTMLFVLNSLSRQVDMCFVVVLFAFGYERQLALRTLCDGLLGIGAAFLLSPAIGIHGVIAATMLSSMLFSVPTSIYFLSRECKVSPASLLKPYAPWFWRFALLVGLCWRISTIGWLDSYPKAAGAGLSILILYVAIMSSFAKKSNLWPYAQQLLARLTKIVPALRKLNLRLA
jgi:O-antigen/teichoic acid export membrane protein